MYDLIIKNATIATFDAKDRILHNASLVVKDGVICDVLFDKAKLPEADRIIDNCGNMVTPGFVDCHTHVVYGGHRAHEFEARLNGIQYQEILKSGGGILSTVHSTRNASTGELLASAKKRLRQMMCYGTTTCEIKSGYALDIANEIRMLEISHRLNNDLPIDIIPTFLGAHAMPPEYQNKDDYIDLIIKRMLPEIKEKRLCNIIDGFCDEIGFTHDQINKLFTAASNLGFKIKLHAEQLSNQNGAKLAAKFGALSVDHLEYLEVEDVPSLRDNDVVAVLLPGAYYFMREVKKPPIQALIDCQVSIAVATDSNPGTSPFLSLPLMMNMACVFFGLTPYQAFKGATLYGAKALGLQQEKGSLEVGKVADIILWNCKDYNQVVCHPTENYIEYYIKGGLIRTYKDLCDLCNSNENDNQEK